MWRSGQSRGAAMQDLTRRTKKTMGLENAGLENDGRSFNKLPMKLRGL